MKLTYRYDRLTDPERCYVSASICRPYSEKLGTPEMFFVSLDLNDLTYAIYTSLNPDQPIYDMKLELVTDGRIADAYGNEIFMKSESDKTIHPGLAERVDELLLYSDGYMQTLLTGLDADRLPAGLYTYDMDSVKYRNFGDAKVKQTLAKALETAKEGWDKKALLYRFVPYGGLVDGRQFLAAKLDDIFALMPIKVNFDHQFPKGTIAKDCDLICVTDEKEVAILDKILNPTSVTSVQDKVAARELFAKYFAQTYGITPTNCVHLTAVIDDFRLINFDLAQVVTLAADRFVSPTYIANAPS